ncbi:MAG: MFS transporter [Bacteroidales bacterium]
MNAIQKAMNESKTLRWAMMVLVSIAMFANYYFYDALSPLKEALQIRLGWSSSNYGFFMSAYSIPNVFFAMAVIGGIILDKLGIRLTGFMFIVFMVLGSALTAYGASETFLNGGPGYDLMNSIIPNFPVSLKMMALGFLLFGLGAETSIVVISKAIVKWFKGKELALALGLNIAFGRLGMAAALWISPNLERNSDPWNLAIWFGTMLLLIGLIAFIVYMFYDIKLDRQIKYELELDETEKFKLADLGKLLTNRSFIFITLLCVTFYSAVFPFVKYAPDLLTNKFGMDAELAGRITSILPFGTILFTPLFGTYTDNRGKSASLMVYGSILLIFVHLMFALTTITPYIPMFLLGVAFSLIPAAMWPSVAKIVPERRLGSAYGLMFSIQNLGLWAFPILIGRVLDISNPDVTPEALEAGTATYDYTNPILMLTLLGLLGVLFAIMLKREDKVSGYGLEQPNIEKKSKE